MRHRITYGKTIRYYLNDVEVTKEKYDDETGSRSAERLRDMFDHAAPPRGVSDCTFMHGSANGRQFAGQEHIGDHYRRVAESMGGQTKGKKYISQLARFPGDPEAWVDGRGDITRALEKRPGWSCEGSVNHTTPETGNPPTPAIDVADDIVERIATDVALRDERPNMVDMVDLKRQVKERIKPKKK